MKSDIVICKDELTSLLEPKWMACYIMTDDCWKHALRAFDANEPFRVRKICDAMAKKANPSDEEIAAAYNRVLSQEIEARIASILKADSSLTRAELEIELCKIILKHYDVFGEEKDRSKFSKCLHENSFMEF